MTPSCKQVLVHLDATRAAPLRLDVARRLAQQQGAALAALYATVPVYLELPYAPDGAPGVIPGLMEVDEERRAAARKAFDEAMKTPGPVATWAESSDVPLIPSVADQAFYADLLVLGQRDPEDAASWSVPPDFPEAVLQASGRPAVVVPYGGWPGAIGSTVAIAWKPTPEAARAVAAALPLLQRASRVHILSWGEETQTIVKGAALDLAGYLRLHGVEATWHHGGPEPEVLGEILLSRVFDLGADLLVMGCYGHSRAREWVLGGTSRTILSSMTLPVLMSH
ncbi:MAG: universal stress protein [Burkholderiales bacterium]|nr:universal stress protein [Burkholderiales bacterium]